MEANILNSLNSNKFSQFNTFVPYQEKVVGFNSYTQEFMVIEPLLHELVKAAKHEQNVDELEEIHPSFFEALQEKGFIVGESVDEVQKVKDLRESVDFNEDLYHLTINPTMNCNFKCWYCYESHIKGSKMNPKTMDKIVKHIDWALEEKTEMKQLHLSWFGGEPMLYFDHVVVPIVEESIKKAEAKGVHFSTSFTTNGYLIRERMVPFFQQNNVNHFQITLDGYRETHNKIRFTANQKGTYDEIVESIKLLCNHGLFVMTRINYTDETLEDILSIMHDFLDLPKESRRNMKFSFHNVWQDKNPNHSKLEGIISIFRENGFFTESVFSIMDTVRNSCYADKKNHATINYNGEVHKCTARDFSSKNKEGTLTEDGRIEWGEKYHRRMDIKFKNKPCLECRLLPICNGGCSQQALEHIAAGTEYCVWEDSGVNKDDIIISKFKQMMEHYQEAVLV